MFVGVEGVDLGLDLLDLSLAACLQQTDVLPLLRDLPVQLLARLLQPLDLLHHHLLIRLTQLALQLVILFELGVLGLDVAVLADAVVARLADGHGHAHLDLERAVRAARTPAGAAVVAEGEHTEALVTELAVVLVLLLHLLGDQVVVRLRRRCRPRGCHLSPDASRH